MVETDNIMKHLLLLPFLLLAASLPAQRFFQPVAESDIQLPESAERKMIPNQYRTYRVDVAGLSAFLGQIPMEFTPEAQSKTTIVEFPAANGAMERFAVWKVLAVEPVVYEQQPELRTFGGVSLDDPGKTIRGSITVRGLQLMVMKPDMEIEYLDPYAAGQTVYYMAYDRRDYPDALRSKAPGAWIPSDDAAETADFPYAPAAEQRNLLPEPVNLRVFRIGVACTGEFSQDQGGTLDLAWAAVIEKTNRVSAIFERDIALRLQLVASSKAATFLNPSTDPFVGTTVDAWMTQAPTVLAQFVGENNYDVGHVYARYLGGAAIGVAGGIACIGSKGRGCSAGYGDYGDGFISVIGQEIGHQFSAGHTWNRCGGGGGRDGGEAYEPGSGTTIMSYAGACGSDNVQGYTDLYYHSGSIEKIRFFYTLGTGTCAASTPTGNHRPDVTLPYQDNFFIPIGTPFELRGSATDADGDTLSYVWEQVDLGPECPLDAPLSAAPLFRTRPPGPNTNRYFPRLSTVLSNGFDLTEQLPTISRDLTFRLAARDNKPGAGGVGWADVAFRATADAGPFLVLAPNTANVSWKVGEYVNIAWDVANTNQAPVSCKKVNIRLSTDGGQTYPVMLAENVENDGSQLVQVPNNLSNSARVRVEAADNVFFDVSNANFKIIQPATPQLSLGLSNDGGSICLPSVFESTVLSAGLLGFNQAVTLELVGDLPPGATAELNPTIIQPGQTAQLNVNLENVQTGGDFSFSVRTTAGGNTLTLPITLHLTRNDFSQLALLAPADGTTGLLQNNQLALRWNTVDDATAYDLQFGKHPAFTPGSILATKTGTTADSFLLPIALETNQIYYWRIRPVNVCGPHPWLDTYTVATETESCTVWSANDLPRFISATGTPTIESKITVNGGGAISDINVKTLDGYHEFFKDLDVRLISPQGTEQQLFAAKCGNFNGSFNFSLDDEALYAFPCPPANNGNAYRPVNPLSVFDGQNPVGVWTLRVKDTEYSSGGAMEAFQIEFCSPIAANPPFLVRNEIMTLDPGVNQTVSADLLLANDVDNTASELIFTLVNTPKHGRLEKYGVELNPGNTFSQADLNANGVQYYNYGFPNGEKDYFRFTLTDGDGGFLGTPKFVMQTSEVLSANNPNADAPALRLYPNPTADAVWLRLATPPAQARIAVFDPAGRLLRSLEWPAGADQTQIDVSDLPRGWYLVQVQTNQGVATQKLARQ
jgi:subtilisin-like proprotein convertase family protein